MCACYMTNGEKFPSKYWLFYINLPYNSHDSIFLVLLLSLCIPQNISDLKVPKLKIEHSKEQCYLRYRSYIKYCKQLLILNLQTFPLHVWFPGRILKTFGKKNHKNICNFAFLNFSLKCELWLSHKYLS